MNCKCCQDGKDINNEGLELAEKEVLPFIKQELLKLKYPNHPLPRRYSKSLNSIFAYAQAMAFDRHHNNMGRSYVTDDPFLLQYKDQLNAKFIRLIICDKLEQGELAQEVCQFNVQK